MTSAYRFIICFVLAIICNQPNYAQRVKKKLNLLNGWSKIDSVAINPYDFTVFNKKDTLSAENYILNPKEAFLQVKDSTLKQVWVSYYAFPKFLSEPIQWIDPSRILPSGWYDQPLPSQTSNLRKQKNKQPFFGLESQGSINRGVSFGNNQNAVVNSSLDLQISGKLSDKVTLQASITDTNIPLQENGYSQNIEEFDRIYLRLYAKKWEIQGGDLMLENNNLKFLRFQKKATGVLVGINQEQEEAPFKTQVSGAIVRGKFTRNNIVAIDNNQGPYKLNGANGEPFIIILSGSETVYVNGKALKRGEQADYTIDYNTAELTFNTTFPIKGSHRIIVEFQYSDRSYNRFVTYNNATFKKGKLAISTHLYSESDAKSQPLQTNLSQDQIEILSQAGNDPNLMVSPSAVQVEFNENEVLYNRTEINDQIIYTYSQDPNDTLYKVSFKWVGEGNGAYNLAQQTAIGNIYEFIGVQQGDYLPITQLNAPNKQQVAATTIQYQANENNYLKGEIAISDSDPNLFSSIDNDQNKGWATSIDWHQAWKKKKGQWVSQSTFDRIDQNFKSIQPLYNVEFARDWAVKNPLGTLQKVNQKLGWESKKSKLHYQFEHLSIGKHYTGNKHKWTVQHINKNLAIRTNLSLLNNQQKENKTQFIRAASHWKWLRKKGWHGIDYDAERAHIKNNTDNSWDPNSQSYQDGHLYYAWGDSASVYTLIGARARINDSVALGKLQRVNETRQIYINSNLIDNKQTKLNLYADFRTVKNKFRAHTQRLQTRLKFRKNFWKNQIVSNTLFESNQGVIPMQNFQYIETDPGQGYFTWIDYNNNNIKEFDEFEVAKFNDQANYLRVALPAINYLAANKNKIYQSLLINFKHWQKKQGLKKWLSDWSNQSFFTLQNQQKTNGALFSNPFKSSGTDVLGLQFNLQNNLYFKRGKQDNSLTFAYSRSEMKQLFGIGFQFLETELFSWEWQNLYKKFWLFSFSNSFKNSQQNIENFNQRNHNLNGYFLNPKITYQVSRNHFLALAYSYHENKNKDPLALLTQHKGELTYQNNTHKKNQFRANYSFIFNAFEGPSNTPLTFTMMEGLQKGNNSVWEVQFQRNLNSYLNLNLIYNGRKSNQVNTIHIGSVQLKAFF